MNPKTVPGAAPASYETSNTLYPVNRRGFLKSAAAGALVAGSAGAATAAPVDMTPDERIAAAMAELGAALREKYPDWTVEVQAPHLDGPDDKRVTSEVLIVNALEKRPCDTEVRFFIDDGAPLRADDVTGTTDWADWLARNT